MREPLGKVSIYACLISAFGKRVILSIRTLHNVSINIGRYGHSSHGLCNRRVRVFPLFFIVLFLRLLLCEFRFLSLYLVYVPAPEIEASGGKHSENQDSEANFRSTTPLIVLVNQIENEYQ